MKLGDRLHVHFNGMTAAAILVGTDEDGNALVNGSPLFGQVPLMAETDCPHPLCHAGQTDVAYYTPAKEVADVKVPMSVSSEPTFVPPAPKAPPAPPSTDTKAS